MSDFLCIHDALYNKYLKTNPKSRLTKHIGLLYGKFSNSVNVNQNIICYTTQDLCKELKIRGVLANYKGNDCLIDLKQCPITSQTCCVSTKLCLFKKARLHINNLYGALKINGFGDLTKFIQSQYVQRHKIIFRKALLRFFRLHGVIIVNNELINNGYDLKKYL